MPICQDASAYAGGFQSYYSRVGEGRMKNSNFEPSIFIAYSECVGIFIDIMNL